VDDLSSSGRILACQIGKTTFASSLKSGRSCARRWQAFQPFDRFLYMFNAGNSKSNEYRDVCLIRRLSLFLSTFRTGSATFFVRPERNTTQLGSALASNFSTDFFLFSVQAPSNDVVMDWAFFNLKEATEVTLAIKRYSCHRRVTNTEMFALSHDSLCFCPHFEQTRRHFFFDRSGTRCSWARRWRAFKLFDGFFKRWISGSVQCCRHGLTLFALSKREQKRHAHTRVIDRSSI